MHGHYLFIYLFIYLYFIVFILHFSFCIEVDMIKLINEFPDEWMLICRFINGSGLMLFIKHIREQLI